MIIGAHTIINSRNPDADRAFLRDVLRLPGVDVGGGWLIFGLPPSEVAVHPSDENGVHEFFLMCDDIEGFVAEIVKRKIRCDPIQDQGWGLLTRVVLPGGGRLGIYEPRHGRPPAFRAGRAAMTSARKPARRPAGGPSKRRSGKTPGKKTRRA